MLTSVIKYCANVIEKIIESNAKQLIRFRIIGTSLGKYVTTFYSVRYV